MLAWLGGKIPGDMPHGLRPPSVEGDSRKMGIPCPAVGLPPATVCAIMDALRAPGSFRVRYRRPPLLMLESGMLPNRVRRMLSWESDDEEKSDESPVSCESSMEESDESSL